MNRLSRLSLDQRLVLVVGFAAMLLFTGDYATSAGTSRPGGSAVAPGRARAKNAPGSQDAPGSRA